MVYHIINFFLLNNDIFSLICLSFGQIAPVPIRYIFSTRNSSENWPYEISTYADQICISNYIKTLITTKNISHMSVQAVQV